MMRIYIPTYQRTLQQETWGWMSPFWRDRTVLVAVPKEVGALRAMGYPVLECPARGIGATRQWILDQHDVDRYGPRLMWMDDDLKFAKRRIDEPTKFLPLDRSSSTDWDAMMLEVQDMLHYVALCGIAPRSGANRNVEPYRRNGRLFDVMAMDVDVVRENGFRIDRVPFMEDFDFTLQFLTRGYQTLMLNSYTKDDRGSNTPGGCSTYRDAAGQAAAARKLAALWPRYVALREAPGWGMDATRLDVRVQWAKAYEAGISLRQLIGDEVEPELRWDRGVLET